MLYRNLSGYLREKYGRRLKKICIDGGFSCPNRDGKCSTGGCIFCGERGSGEHIAPDVSIEEQVRRALLDSREDELFIAYFQNFTNTYAPPEVLKKRYDAALIDERIKVLSIGTRPDCISEENAKLIAEYGKDREVWVELGLQTASDRTAALINRGYAKDSFEAAMEILSRYRIRTVVHMIIGLPGESCEDALATAKYIASHSPFGVKIHSLYVMRGTVLHEMYDKKLYTPPTLDEYAKAAADAIRQMPKETVIHRITGDCPRELLIAPEWNADKSRVIERINHYLSLSEK